MTGRESTQSVDVEYCVVCGSENVVSTFRMDCSEHGKKSETLAKCFSCHSTFRCNTTVSSDPTTETRRRGGRGE